MCVCVCMEEIEDSELLEMMDVCDQENKPNPLTQQQVIPVLSTAQVMLYFIICFSNDTFLQNHLCIKKKKWCEI